MTLIVIVFIGLLYIGAAIWATTAAVRNIRANGGGRAARWLWGGAAALVFYLIPFWDWIPMLVMHRYYCANEAKFEINKTPEAWIAENSDVLPSLRRSGDTKGVDVAGYRRYPLNQRLAVESKPLVSVFPGIRREEARFVDMKTGEVLSQYVEFLTGYGSFSVGGASA